MEEEQRRRWEMWLFLALIVGMALIVFASLYVQNQYNALVIKHAELVKECQWLTTFK